MPSDEEDQVSSADQQKINKFSRLNGRLHEIGEELDIQRVSLAHRPQGGPRATTVTHNCLTRALAPLSSCRRKPSTSSTTSGMS
jgi:hypothetical protein